MKNTGMPASSSGPYLVARCLAPACGMTEAFDIARLTCGQRRLPPEAVGVKLRCRCGSRQVRVERCAEPAVRRVPPWAQLWVL
jgi:hypothetical protein